MDREIIEKKRADVLFEPSEPLFGDMPKRKKGIGALPVIAFSFVAITAAVLACFLMNGSGSALPSPGGGDFSGGFAGSEAGGGYNGTEESDRTGEEESSSSNDTEYTESSEETEVSDIPENIKIESVDLSCPEKGDEYIMNYTGKIIDVSALADVGFSPTERPGGEAPVVMIIHTHTSEEYSGESSDGFKGLKSVVSVGEQLNERLNLLGVPSIHCTVIHDASGEDAYANARDTVKTMLEIYPSIKYIIDVHRLMLKGDGGELIRTVSSTPDNSAQIRLTAAYREGYGGHENLCLALALRSELNYGESRLCMPVAATALTYNSDLTSYYLLADVGSIGNSVEEAISAADRLAVAFSRVISK